MKRFLTAVLVTACLLGGGAAVHAAGVEIQGLYDALVPVDSQAPAERRRALNTALFDVLVKVTGRPRERLVEVLGARLEEPVRFVRQYRYESLPELEGAGSGSVQSLALGVSFDKAAVDRLARDAGLPVWGRVRPTTVVWLAAETAGGRRLLGEGDRPEVWAALKGRARERGIPLVIPLLDLEDQTALRPAELWGGFAETIRSASARYGDDAILVGRLDQGTAGLEESAWVLYRGDDERGWRLRQGGHPRQAAQAVDRLTESIARDFTASAPGGAPGALEMVVSGLRTVDDYGTLMTYLHGLDAVAAVAPVTLDGDRVTLRLRSAAPRQQVLRTLTLGRVLTPLATEGELRFGLAP